MDLFPHNREAYESAVRLFREVNRVCIIRPTGTGKSVIIAEFVNRNYSKRHLLLAPGSHIFKEIQKHIRAGEISSSTYIGLKLKKAFFIPDSFDYIYLDEFHRLGAEVWGGAVERLLKINPNAKVLGTSATPIRYLDDNRNMASEIFNDCIATQMSLNLAIAEGILPAPVYVSALYSVREEFQEMKKKILSSDLGDKKKLANDLDSKVIDWEKSSGLDVVLKRHLHAERRRVIVFCKDWEHLKNAQKILGSIFKSIYGKVESLSLYSKIKGSENESALKLFSGEDQRAVILYTIDKVNEGLHSKNCNTVILLRDTISPTVFYQQIGRAFSIKVANRPLIIDLVNNFKNVQLASFKNDFERELTSSISKSQIWKKEKSKAAIEFIDEIQDIREIFTSFDEKVDVWKRLYERGKIFYKEQNHLYVPMTDRELYKWVTFQRSDYKQGKMSKEREALLKVIGVDFDNKIPYVWMIMFYEWEKWVEKNGKPINFSAARLNSWIQTQRNKYRRGGLCKEQINMLNKVTPLELNMRGRVLDRVDTLISHFKNGTIDTADTKILRDLRRINFLYKANKLPEDYLVNLQKGGVPFETLVIEKEWLKRINELVDHYESHGEPPKQKGNSGLYQFCMREKKYINQVHPFATFIKNDKGVGRLHKKVQKIVSVMGAPDWDKRCSELKRIATKHGCISAKNCDFRLLQWMYKQRLRLQRNQLPLEKIKKLLTIKEVNWYDWRGKRLTRTKGNKKGQSEEMSTLSNSVQKAENKEKTVNKVTF